ncbi:hypothetical protein [Sphingomonas sp.]|uniref:hypothetical protein n=1 Tax=Sphingomonas sp. TaxID=28214 RepID=UPI0035BC387B
MPGSPVPFGSTVLCAHAGQATASAPNLRVTLGGQPSVLQPPPWAIAGCTLPPPPAANGPCVTGQWLAGTTRVLSNGQPLVIAPAPSLCAPSGTPMIAVAPFARVTMM